MTGAYKSDSVIVYYDRRIEMFDIRDNDRDR
jgi:hypothetical protein